MSGNPVWLNALMAGVLLMFGIAFWWGCWKLTESPALLHFFHGFDPLCNRCFRVRRLRAERARHDQMIRELRERHAEPPRRKHG